MSSFPVLVLEPENEAQEESLVKLSRDLKKAAATLSRDEARYLVDCFYSMQKQRIVAGNQVKALEKTQEPHEVLNWLNSNSDFLEKQIRAVLLKYAESFQLGRWALSQYGIGPVLAAGLLAHIDIEKAPTVGHIWSFAGLNPTAVWAKGQKRPWNASLKVLCWKIGESFVNMKPYIDKGAVYAGMCFDRRTYEQAKSASGAYSAQAEALVKARPTHAQVATYQAGKLPDGHIWARSKRYAVKMFLAHYHEVAYELRYGTLPPKPYVVAHLGHAHVIKPTHWPLEAKYADLPQLP